MLNLSDILKIGDRFRVKNTQEQRMSRVRKNGTGFYTLVITTLAAGTYQFAEMEITFPALKKYGQPNWIEVANNDVVDVTLYINGMSDYIQVLAGTIRNLRRPAIFQIAIQNNDAASAITANKVVVKVRYAPVDADELAREAL